MDWFLYEVPPFLTTAAGGVLGARGPLTARGCPVTGGGENLMILDCCHLPPRRRPERTGQSYHNKVLAVARQDGEGLALTELIIEPTMPPGLFTTGGRRTAAKKSGAVRAPAAPARFYPPGFDLLTEGFVMGTKLGYQLGGV